MCVSGGGNRGTKSLAGHAIHKVLLYLLNAACSLGGRASSTTPRAAHHTRPPGYQQHIKRIRNTLYIGARASCVPRAAFSIFLLRFFTRTWTIWGLGFGVHASFVHLHWLIGVRDGWRLRATGNGRWSPKKSWEVIYHLPYSATGYGRPADGYCWFQTESLLHYSGNPYKI